MNRATTRMRAIAGRLIAHEAVGNDSSGTKGPAAFGGAVEKLSQPLVSLTGTAGFRSLLSRSLALAADEVGWLRAVHVKTDGSLECPDLTQFDQLEVAEGEAALIAQLLGLLVTFIGEPLTLRLVQGVWPGTLVDNLVSDKAKNEKAK